MLLTLIMLVLVQARTRTKVRVCVRVRRLPTCWIFCTSYICTSQKYELATTLMIVLAGRSDTLLR